MSGDIGIQIDYTGVEQGGAQLDAVIDRLGALLTEEERAAISTQRLERAMQGEAQQASALRGALGQAAQAHSQLNNAANGAQQTLQQTGARAGQFVSSLGAIGNAVRGLDPQLAGIASSVSAVGAAVTASAGAMGPLGIAVGAVTAGMALWSNAMEASRERTEALRAEAERAKVSFEDLVEAIRRAESERARSSRIAMGLGSGQEQQAALTEAHTRRILLEQRERAMAEGIRRRRTSGQGIFAGEEEELEAVRRQLRAAEARVEEQREALRTMAREDVESMQEDLDTGAAEDEARQRRRRGGGRRRRREQQDPGDRFEMEREFDEAANERDLEIEREAIRLAEDRKEHEIELARIQRERLEAQKDKEREAHDLAMELLEKQKEAERQLQEERAQQMEEVTGHIEGNLQRIAGAYIDAFGEAISGQKTLEQASLDATKLVLKGIGEEMVGIGLKETVEGFANIVSNPPVAATKIPAGVALIGLGVGLGAAGAAIPSAPAAAPERPRQDEGEGGGGDQTIVLNMNQPLVSAQTNAQLSRMLQRQMRDTEFRPSTGTRP